MGLKKEDCFYFQNGEKNKVALIFSCPGNKELKQNLPVSGMTGKNLDKLLVYLKEKKIFTEYKNKGEFRITNAWNQIESKSETKRTEATFKNIRDNKENLNRLYFDIFDITDCIICFGKKAEFAIKELEKEARKLPKVIFVRHLSLQSLNTSGKKIEDIGDEIINEINNNTLV